MAFPAGFPTTAMVDQNGQLVPVWRLFLVALYDRTGAGGGGSMTALQAEITAETAARQAADIALSGAISAEAAARTAAVGAETTRAEAAEAALAAEITTVSNNAAGFARQWFMSPV